MTWGSHSPGLALLGPLQVRKRLSRQEPGHGGRCSELGDKHPGSSPQRHCLFHGAPLGQDGG